MAEPVVEMVTGSPAPPLRDLIGTYAGYRQEGVAQRFHRGLPSRHLTIVLSLDRPLDIATMPDPATGGPASFWALAGGLHAAPVLIRHDGYQHGVHIELTPLGARSLLGLPAGALASDVVDLGEFLGRRAVELTDRLHGAGTWTERFGIIDDVLIRAVSTARRPPVAPPEVSEAWRLLVASAGAVEVAALAGEVGWSRRHLAERFRSELGLPPKVAARVLRFERACRLLRSSPPGRRPGLAELAAECAYYDQAHLNRDWRELAGCSPTTWMAEELPFVQDTGAGGEASSRHDD
ncbi:MAG: helix-turn-helix domain-containing protein [Acidimicrobiia bacterium]